MWTQNNQPKKTNQNNQSDKAKQMSRYMKQRI